ncbi:MAG: C4-dicarboxylic acid transporter DauA [Gammaproteobacteria bacterium]|nr:C4-dicarboxylic acid transporter DauA [Gammaproteobacteria bacterium]MCP5135699.1 C4-dicarboxylic acid transporter DauA [Gammaproteobacteria bacterium]
MFSALRASMNEDRTFPVLQANVLAGLTVGVIALPLSMALAIATGVSPQHGLYTAIVAGIAIALSGGSRVAISGPTAAFVVILLPIVQQFGVGGLMTAGFMAGLILIAMGVARLGRLVEIIPYPVTIGFTAGIGTVIATLQIKDFLGLEVTNLNGHFTDKVLSLFSALPSLDWGEFGIGGLTLTVLILWRRTQSRIPAHLVALLVGTLTAWVLGRVNGFDVDTIGSRFFYTLNGVVGQGIPPMPPAFNLPWNQPGPDGQPLGLSFDLIRNLLGPALTIAALGSIESLLCAVVAEGMSGKRHSPNDELIGQGLGNLIVPLFGGIPATAAIARTAANVRAGATSPLSSVVHALFILAAILFLAPLLAYIPMASMSALLLMVAWNMSEAPHFLRTLRVAPRPDVAVLLTCYALTVLFDMVIAVGVGLSLAAVLFIRSSIGLTQATPIKANARPDDELTVADSVIVYDINGPLFFGSAQKALKLITTINPNIRIVILDMSGVTMLDMTAIIALDSIIDNLRTRKVETIIADLQPRMIEKLHRAGIHKQRGLLRFAHSLPDALILADRHAAQASPDGDHSHIQL